jgi:hypothetical protein
MYTYIKIYIIYTTYKLKMSNLNCIGISEYMARIMLEDYPILDIGNKNGSTGYLDFIQNHDVSNSVTKGKDKYNRPFFVIRALITRSDNSTESTLETFFQRYTNDDSLWHGCGHSGHYFISTEGGMNIKQAEFIIELLKNKYVNLTEKLMEDIKFHYYFTNGSIVPIKIELN